MALTDAEKTDVRRHCGYPAYGASASGNTGWRFYQAFGELEYRAANLSDAELAVTRQYLATLATLEAAVPASGENLDTDQAAVWTRNRDESRDRAALFDDWRRRLCGFLGVAAGPALAGSGGLAIIV